MGDPPPVPPGHFRCDACGAVTPLSLDPQEAVAEAEILFGGELPPGDRATVCDACYAEVLKQLGIRP